jgi:hypothetical protein
MLAESESQLQDLVKNNPDLLPVDELGMTGPLMVVGRETTLRSGAVDLVCLARSGELLVIEFKTGPQNSDFRHALAQLLDYGADLWRMTVDEFESTVATRYFNSAECQDSRLRGKQSLEAAMSSIWSDMAPEELVTLRDALAQQLSAGALHYVLAAQQFTPTMAHTIEYLNATTGASRFYAIEVVRFGANGINAFEARTVLKPESVVGGGSPPELTSEARFLEAIVDETYRDALHELFEVSRGLKLRAEWGTKGVSIRLPTPDRSEPLTIAWVFPSGGVGWMGLSDVNLGYDPSSAAKTPSVSGALERFLGGVAALPGVESVKPTWLRAYHVAPSVVVAQRNGIAEILASLVQQEGDAGGAAATGVRLGE